MRIDIHDVGHGACAVVTAPNGARIMLDCGLGLDPAWFPSISYGGQFIDLLVITNLDEDHVCDLPYLWRDVRLGGVFSNPTVTGSALASMKSKHGMKEGVTLAHNLLKERGSGTIGQLPSLGEVRGWCCWNRYGSDFSDTNNLSLATFLRWGRFTILFGGDLEAAGWRALLRIPGLAADLATVNIYVASHHGRESGCCAELFEHMRPDIVMFSDDARRYATQETDAWYRQRVRGIVDFDKPAGIFGQPKRHVMTTRRDGAMTILVNEAGGYTVTTYRKSPTTLFDAFSPKQTASSLLR